MGELLEDIKVGANTIVKLYALEKITMDYSIKSFIEIDRFFNKNSKDGKPTENGVLKDNLGMKLFCFGAYIGETIIKTVPGSIWVPDEKEPNDETLVSIKLANGTICWPVQRIMKRLKNGAEDSIYPYGYELTKVFTNEHFEEKFWQLENTVKEGSKQWWKFW